MVRCIDCDYCKSDGREIKKIHGKSFFARKYWYCKHPEAFANACKHSKTGYGLTFIAMGDDTKNSFVQIGKPPVWCPIKETEDGE